ncbi:hypothetical protein ACP3P6_07100 [Enterobacter mori]
MNTQWRYCPVALALMTTLWPHTGWSELLQPGFFIRRRRQRSGFVAF